jgi:hypothetical protein
MLCGAGSEVSTAGPLQRGEGGHHSSNPNSPSGSEIDVDEAGPRMRYVPRYRAILLNFLVIFTCTIKGFFIKRLPEIGVSSELTEHMWCIQNQSEKSKKKENAYS